MTKDMMMDNPQTTKRETEELQVIHSYVNSILEIKNQIHELDGSKEPQGYKMFNAGIQMMLLQKELYRLCWVFIYDHPFTTQIDPLIEIERDNSLRPIQIKFADALLPWPPHQMEDRPVIDADYGAADGTTTR